MTVHSNIREVAASGRAKPAQHPFAMCADLMAPFYRNLETARQTVRDLSQDCEPHLAVKLDDILSRIEGFEPNVTLVGQVKAGKTALTNVLSGHPGFLRSDVNPMTSVITTLHLNARHPDGHTRAAFEFFSRGEWDSLCEGGGRLGELAARAGAEDELQMLRLQIEDMRRSAEKRLGAKFEPLLGKKHLYDNCDAGLVERYVCLGDPDEADADPAGGKGRFADITKSADLYLAQPNLPGALCLRDTPGVNDTFMVREQITLRALSRSQICVIVLSAHEALNTADLALVRLISAMEDRQVILFVNRIDELSKPSKQIPEIRESILKTLATLNATKKISLLFGSARWAEVALTRDYGDLDECQRAALFDWAARAGLNDVTDTYELAWLVSGVPALMLAVYERILERPGKRLVDGIGAQLNNIIAEIRAADSAPATKPLVQLEAELDRLIDGTCGLLDATLERLVEDLRPRLHRVQENYVARATEALVAHMQKNGRQDTWTFGSSGLRFVLKSTYVRFAGAAETEVEDVFSRAAGAIRDVYLDTFDFDDAGFDVEPPQMPSIPPPVVLGQTIAVDLGSSWWKRWWQRRKGIESYSEDYARLIRAEVGSIVRDLESIQFNEVLIEIRTILREFMVEQKQTILRLAASAESGRDDDGAEDDGAEARLIEAIGGVVDTLDRKSAAA